MSTLVRSVVAGSVIALAALAAGLAVTSGAQGPLVPSSARPFGTVPSTITGNANARHLERDAPQPSCASVEGVEWYTATAPRQAAMLARLVAKGDLDAVLVAYRVVGSRRTPLACRRTGAAGRAAIAFYGYPTGSYLIGVARIAGSPKGDFELSLLTGEPPETAPGAALPAAGVSSTVNSALDRTDACAVSLARGTTYMLDLAGPKANCVSYALYRPGTLSFTREHPVMEQQCGGYTTFTPGIDGGGTYTVLVHSAGPPLTHMYRLQVAAAGPDDTAPGVHLANGQIVSGTLFGNGVDTVDLYRFTVARGSELTAVRLGEKKNVGFDLVVMTELGRRVAVDRTSTGPRLLRLHLVPGPYYVALRARGGGGGRYTLQVQVRDITTTSITAGGARTAETAPGAAVPLSVSVTSASHGGRVLIELDHYDPLFGWHFDSTLPGQVDAGGSWTASWTPPSVGVFRARAVFVGNPYSSYSSSGYVGVHVAEPLE